MHFTATADELPRLFAQEAITVARSSFVERADAPRARCRTWCCSASCPASPFPGVDGYNLTYLRPGATMGVVTTDEHKAPVLAFWHRGLGRVAALTAEVDGRYSTRLNAWNGFPGVRRRAGPLAARRRLRRPASQASLERQGGQGIVRVELDPGRARGGADDVRAATAAIVSPGRSGTGDAFASGSRWRGWARTRSKRAFRFRRRACISAPCSSATGRCCRSRRSACRTRRSSSRARIRKRARGRSIEIARVSGGIERTTWDDVFSAQPAAQPPGPRSRARRSRCSCCAARGGDRRPAAAAVCRGTGVDPQPSPARTRRSDPSACRTALEAGRGAGGKHASCAGAAELRAAAGRAAETRRVPACTGESESARPHARLIRIARGTCNGPGSCGVAPAKCVVHQAALTNRLPPRKIFVVRTAQTGPDDRFHRRSVACRRRCRSCGLRWSRRHPFTGRGAAADVQGRVLQRSIGKGRAGVARTNVNLHERRRDRNAEDRDELSSVEV